MTSALNSIFDTLSPTSFYFVRHGTTAYNLEHLYTGQHNIALHPRGIEQAHQAAQLLQNSGITTIVSSPLERALHTATIIGSYLQRPITVIEDLQDSHWGVLQGKSVKDKKHDAMIDVWITGGVLEGAEPRADFTIRVFKALQHALALPGPVLIVSHGGVYWELQQQLEFKEKTVPNCVPYLVTPPTTPGGHWSLTPIIPSKPSIAIEVSEL